MKKQNNLEPPMWPIRILRWFYDDASVEGITGDLFETYERRLLRLTKTRARFYYFRDFLSMFRPSAIKKMKRNITPNAITMFTNYFKLTIRGVKANPMISLISILGLSISISCCIVLFVFGQQIVTANDFIRDSDNIHLIYSKAIDINNDAFDWGRTPELLGPALFDEAEGAPLMTRYKRSSAVTRYDDLVIEEAIQFVDVDFLDIFSFDLQSGSRHSLKNGQVVLSNDVASRFFGDQDPIGEELMFIINNERIPLIVGAVAKKFPTNAYFDFNLLLPFSIRPQVDDWKGLTHATFIKPSNTNLIQTLMSKQAGYIEAYNSRDPKYKLTSLATIPFSLLSQHEHNIVGISSVVGRENESTLIATIFFGALLLFIACFNYINIALVAASKKLKEIGLRKTVGASRKQLVIQFLSQNIFLSCFAVLSGLLISYLILMPLFSSFFPLDFALDLTDSRLWIFLLLIAVITGLISGGYPAFYISSFSAVNIFSGKQTFGNSRNVLFKLFLGLQFGITFLIIFSGIAFYQNSSYQKGLSWGYDQDGLLIIPVESSEQFLAIRDNLHQRSDVTAIAGATRHVGKNNSAITFDMASEKSTALNYPVSDEYFNTMGIRLFHGRGFDPNMGNDRNSLVVNEAFAKKYFIQELPSSMADENGNRYEIIGVVKDFHYRNFYSPIEAVSFSLSKESENRFIILRTEASNLAQLDGDVRRMWLRQFPDYPYNGYLQADMFDPFFREMAIPTNSLITFAVISILLSSIGLFGLVSLMISKKLKEISLRKVLGARMTDLALLTNKPYVIILGVSMLIAAPLSQNLVEGYLKEVNAYPVAIDYKIIVPSIILLTSVILLTITANLYKVSITNPTETLRSE
ncbi:MAG: ABC transporter permease [Fulvivirga sp.]